jgi:hypothetical protein
VTVRFVQDVTSLRTRSTVVVVLLVANIVWSVVAIGSTIAEIGLLERARNGEFVTYDEALASDRRVQAVAVGALFLAIVTMIVWLVWQHRGQRNLVGMGVRGLRFTPGWAVGWWFVPIANVWKPFQTVRELWRGSRPDAVDSSWPGERTWSTIGWWWALFLLSSISIRVSVGLDEESRIEDYIRSDRVDIVTELFSIGAAILAIAIVRAVTRRQDERIRLGPPVPPRPDLGGGWRP